MGAKSKKRSKRKFLESQRRKSLMSRKNRINLNHDNETDKQENYKSLNEIGPSTAEQKPIESPLTVLDLDDQSVYTCRFDPSEDNISDTHSPVSPNTTGNIMCKQKQPRPKKEISKKKSTLKDNTNKKRKSDYDKENTSCQSDVNKRSNKKAKLSHLPKNTCKMDAEQTCPYEVEAYNDDADGYTKVTVTGRRIVNIQSFFDQLKDVAHHSSLFSCGFHCIEIVSECKKGLYSRLNLECTLCKKKFQIETTDRDINKNAVSGVMASGHPRHKLIRDNEPTTNYKPTTSHQPPEFSLQISETPKKRSEKIMQPRQKNVASPRIQHTNPPTLHRIIDFSKL